MMCKKNETGKMGASVFIKCQRLLHDWPPKNGSLRKRFGIFISLLIFLVFICYTCLSVTQFDDVFPVNVSKQHSHSNVKKYLIHTSKCRIPDDDPFNEDVLKFFHPESYRKCSNKDLLTYIEQRDNAVTLNINDSLLSSYSAYRVSCCYSVVTRVVHVNKSDDEVKFSECKPFDKSANIVSDVIRVTCRNPYKIEVYSNVHAIIDPNRIPRQNVRSTAKKLTDFSVLFVGIDSISKMNLVRAMPKTFNFLEKHDFVNLRGYTKIGDNTFPNLMAILTGKTWKQVYAHCDPGSRQMNHCDIIWDRFKELGYVTAYGEDETSISTFNYRRKGFFSPPTDYYFRPYLLAAEKLTVFRRYGMTYCSGPETSGERVLNLAKDFSIALKNYSKFSLFWMNTFSHDNVNIVSSMDGKVERFLREVYGHLDNTIFIFFSDHGFRFGDIRYTHTGWLEERLPFIYIHLPNSFKERYVSEYRNFVVNSRRLTTPYDLHMTLQDILLFSDKNYTIVPSQACPKCHSLFQEIDEARTCKDGAIDQHWCMCTGHFYVDTKSLLVNKVARFIVSEINALVKTYNEGHKCAGYSVAKIVSAGMSKSYLNEQNQSVNYFLLIIESTPKAMFEATVEASLQLSQPVFRLLGDISRINRYADNSFCVEDSTLRKYCYCDGLFNFIKSAICSLLNCF